MKKIKDAIDINILESFSILVIISVLTIVSIGSILVVYHTLSLKQFSYFLICLMPLELVLYFLYKIKSFKYRKKEILILLLFLFTGLSLVGCNNLNVSIWGFYNRYEGLLVIYSYYSIALLTSTIQSNYYKKVIICFILLIGLINVFYGLFQTGIIPLKIDIKDSWKYARGFYGNSMYFASLMSICYFFVVGLLLFSIKLFDWRIILLLIIFTVGNVISGSMALFCTTIFLYIILIIRELIGFKLKFFSKIRFLKIICCIIIFVLINIIFFNRNQSYQRDVTTLSKEVSSFTEVKEKNNSFGTGRIYIWKKILKKSKEHFIFGVGVDNLYYSFNPRLIDPVSGYEVDKAHNDYLQKFFCEGLFSFICYIVLLAMIVLDNYKCEDKIRSILFLGFFAYITQIFFNISVIRVSPIYWIILGLLLNSEIIKKKKVVRKKQS